MFALDIATLTHGSAGLGLAWGATALSLAAGMVRKGASARRLLVAPLAAVPVMALGGMGSGMASSLAAALAVPGAGLVSVGLGATAMAAGGYFAGRWLATSDRHADQYRRGAIVQEAGGAARMREILRGAGRRREAGITLAAVPVPRQDETKHFKIIGTTGTGKSTALNEILAGALARGDRAVIADPDGGYLRRFYDRERGDVVLNPFRESAHRWDLFGEVEKPYDIDQLARSLIPDHEGSDRPWRAYARTFFIAVMQRAPMAGVRDIAGLHRLLVMEPVPGLRTLLAGTVAQPYLDENNGRMFDSVRSVTSSALAALEYAGQQQGPPLSVRQWVRRGPEGGGVLFLPYQAGEIAALRSQISAWMRLAIFEAMNRPEGDQRLWFVVDELDALGQIDGLKDALARLRKFGGRCALGFQSVAQVSGTYGHSEAHTIVENCANTLVLRASASEGGGTARFAAGLIGEREVLRTDVSRSHRPLDLAGSITRAGHVITEAAVLPSQIEQLPDLTGYLKLASSPQWRRVRLSAAAATTSTASTGQAASAARDVAGAPAHAREHRDAGLEI